MARHALTDLLRRRIVVAPMAGGPSTTERASRGAPGFLAAGYQCGRQCAGLQTGGGGGFDAPGIDDAGRGVGITASGDPD
jgi:hypothetical protein